MNNPLGCSASENNVVPDFRIHATEGVNRSQSVSAARLALVCEGGGQRGIFTAGILDSFMHQNFFPFHSLLGVSAGAQNLSSYACNQYGYARDAILHYTTTREFYSPLRFARGGNLIDLDWYFSALSQHMPLDIGQGMRRLEGRSFHLCASRCENLQAEYLPFESGSADLALKASCAIPLLYRDGVALGGVEYWDGGVADSLPVQAAHQRGSDCIVVIRTQPRDAMQVLNRMPKNWRLKGLQKWGSVVESYVNNYTAAMQFIDHPPAEVGVIDLAPAKPLRSRLMGSSLEMLQHDYEVGRHCGQKFLDSYAWRFQGSTDAR